MRAAVQRAAWLHTALFACLLVLLSGCAALGLPQAQSFNERLAVSYGSVASVRSAATTALRAQRISVEDAVNIQAQADNARAGLDVARGLAGTDLAAAETRLEAAQVILEALQRYLEGTQ